MKVIQTPTDFFRYKTLQKRINSSNSIPEKADFRREQKEIIKRIKLRKPYKSIVEDMEVDDHSDLLDCNKDYGKPSIPKKRYDGKDYYFTHRG